MKQRRLTQFLLSVSAAILVTTTPIWADNSIDDSWPEDDMWSEDDPWPEDDLWGEDKLWPDDMSDSEFPDSDYSAYDDKIDKVPTAIQNDYEPSENDDFSFIYSYPGDKEQYGYAMIDLDGDGSDELLFGASSDYDEYGSMVFDLYTIVNDECRHLFSGWDRNRYYVCEDGTIANEGSSGAISSSTAYYRLQNGDLQLVEAIIIDGFADETNPWFYSTVDAWDSSTASQISEEEYQSIYNKYSYRTLDFTSFLSAPAVNDTDNEHSSEVGIMWYEAQLIGDQIPHESNDANLMGSILSVNYSGDTAEIYASFRRYENDPVTGWPDESTTQYMDYTSYTFHVPDYAYFYGTDIDGEYPYTVSEFFSICQRYNGLGVLLKVENGNLVQGGFYS